MNIDAKVGGRTQKGDFRDTSFWVGQLELKATREGEQFILAAIVRAITGDGSDALRKHLADEARECQNIHRQEEAMNGMNIRITS